MIASLPFLPDSVWILQLWLCKSLSASLQLFSVGIAPHADVFSMGEGELHVLLLCHVDLLVAGLISKETY